MPLRDGNLNFIALAETKIHPSFPTVQFTNRKFTEKITV